MSPHPPVPPPDDDDLSTLALAVAAVLEVALVQDERHDRPREQT